MMINQIRDRTMTRTQWNNLRCRVRRHILIDAKHALDKRMLLEDNKVFLMGGIVLKKQYMAIIDNEKDDPVECVDPVFLMPIEEARQKIKQETAVGTNAFLRIVSCNLWVHDFSGTIKVNGVMGSLNKDHRLRIDQIQEGDVVFFDGKLSVLRDAAGYQIDLNNIYTEEEVEFYRWVYADRYTACRLKMKEIKESRIQDSLNYALMYCRNSWDALKLLLRPFLYDFRGGHYDVITMTVYELYQKTKDIRVARLVLKYYLLAAAMNRSDRSKHGHCDPIWDELEADREKLFFGIYSDLQGVIEWPQED